MFYSLGPQSRQKSPASIWWPLTVQKESVTQSTLLLLIRASSIGRSRHFIGVSFLGETKAADRMWAANVEVPNFSREVQSFLLFPATLTLYQYWHRWGDFAQAACDSRSLYFSMILTHRRTSLKPINPGSQFQMQSLGPNLPKDVPQDLVGTQELFNSIAKRDDLVFTSVQWITEWK
jgi:hypothetical protein